MEIKNSVDLKAAIQTLKDRQQQEKKELVENFHAFSESIKPINIIKSTFNKVKESPGFSGNVLKATMGLGVGLISKRFLLGKTPGLFKRIVGSAIEMGVAGLVSKNSDSIKSKGSRFFKNLFRSNHKGVVM